MKMEIHNEHARGRPVPQQGSPVKQPPGRPSAVALLALGVILIGAAIVVLAGHNWDTIPRSARLTGLLAGTACLNWFCIALYRTNQTTGRAFSIIVFLIVGPVLALIAKMYHPSLSPATLAGIWILAAIPVWLKVRSLTLAVLISLLSLAALITQADQGSLLWWYPLSAFLLLYFSLQIRRTYFVLLIAYFGLLFFIVLALSIFKQPPQISTSLLSLFGFGHVFTSVILALLTVTGARAFSAIPGISHEVLGAAAALRLYALRALAATLMIFSFKPPWEAMMKELPADALMISVVSAVFIVLQFIFLLVDFLYARSRPGEFIANRLGAVLGPLLLCSLPLLSMTAQSPQELAFELMVATNLLTVATAIGLILDGIRSGSTFSVIFGALLMAGLGVARYIEFVGDYIGSAVILASAGLLVIVLARCVDRHFRGEGC